MNNCLLWCSYVACFSEISLTFFVEYIIHPQKTHNVCKQCSSTVDVNAREEWNIGDKSLHQSERTTHLGLARTDKNDCAVNVADRISLARRTGYSLMKSGFQKKKLFVAFPG